MLNLTINSQWRAEVSYIIDYKFKPFQVCFDQQFNYNDWKYIMIKKAIQESSEILFYLFKMFEISIKNSSLEILVKNL